MLKVEELYVLLHCSTGCQEGLNTALAGKAGEVEELDILLQAARRDEDLSRKGWQDFLAANRCCWRQGLVEPWSCPASLATCTSVFSKVYQFENLIQQGCSQRLFVNAN